MSDARLEAMHCTAQTSTKNNICAADDEVRLFLVHALIFSLLKVNVIFVLGSFLVFCAPWAC
jgi:hypothetical protein